MALSAACREELISRHVAKIVEPVRVTSKSYEPWTIEETLIFLRAVRRDPMYAAIMLAIGLGLRRGEIVGLKWSQVDFNSGTLHLGKQLQRRGGEL